MPSPESLLKDAVRRVASLWGGIRRQAPGARMVGEFVVKGVAGSVSRKISGGGTGTTTSSDDGPSTPSSGI